MRVKRYFAVLPAAFALAACSSSDSNAIGTSGPMDAGGGSGGSAASSTGGAGGGSGGSAASSAGGSGGAPRSTGGTRSMLDSGPIRDASTRGRGGNAGDSATEVGSPCPPASDAGGTTCVANDLTLKSTNACDIGRTTAASVIAGMSARFLLCYEQALSRDPSVHGTVTLTIQVAPSGNVTAVTATSDGNLPASVARCMQTAAYAESFDPARSATTFVTSYYAGCGPAGDAMP